MGLYEIVMGSRNIVESMEYVKPSMVEWTSQLDQAMFELPINTVKGLSIVYLLFIDINLYKIIFLYNFIFDIFSSIF